MITTKKKKYNYKRCKEIALLKVLNNSKETLEATTIVSHLKLSDVKKYYCQFLRDLNLEFVNVNLACLKKRLSKLNANLEAILRKREVFMPFQNDMAAVIIFFMYTNSN